jgi:hypothetical protein
MEEKKQMSNLRTAHSSHSNSSTFSPLKDRLRQKAMSLFYEAENKVKIKANKFKIPKYSVPSDSINIPNGADASCASSINVKINPHDVKESTKKKGVASSTNESLKKTDGGYYKKSNSVSSKSYTQEASILDNGQSSSDEASMGDMMQKYAKVLSSFVACTGKS